MKKRWETSFFWRSMRLFYWIWLDQTSAPFGQEKEKRNSNCPPPRAFQSTIFCFQCWAPTFAKMNWSDAVNGPGKVVEPHADCTAMHVFTTFTDVDVSLEPLGNCCQVGFAWWTPRHGFFFCLQQKICSAKQPRIQVEKHMIVTATTEVYIATAFEPWFYLVFLLQQSRCSMFEPEAWSSESLPRSDSACEACVPLAKMWGEKWDLQIGSQVACVSYGYTAQACRSYNSYI